MNSPPEMNRFSEFGPTFCVLPWVHMMACPDGTLQICCVSKKKVETEDGQPLHLSTASLHNTHNSELFKDTRRRMLAGEKLLNCEACYAAESLGKFSYRQGSNWWWYDHHREVVLDLVEKSRESNLVHQSPQSLDLRLGNHCNLSCRSCEPVSSSTLHKEWQKIRAENPDFEEFWNGHVYHWPTTAGKEPASSWHEEPRILEEIKQLLPTAKLLYLTGGESMMVKANYDLIEACITEGYSQNIELMLNTNLSIYNKKIYDSFSRFKKVQLNCSIDGFEKMNDYLRYPSKWENIDRNLRRLLNTPGNIRATANIVAQFHNVLNITDLLRYLESLNAAENLSKINIDLILLERPDWLQVTVLPLPIRIEAKRRLLDFVHNSRLWTEDIFSRKSIEALISLLGQEKAEAGELLNKNLRFTHCLDQNRKVNLRDSFPELEALLMAL